MKDDRLRIPVAMDYLPSLGLALFAFARTEWQAVHICEKLQKGYANQVVGKKKTATTIAADLIRMLSKDTQKWSLIKNACIQFKQLAEVRNQLVHGKPGATPTGEQNLFNGGSVWTIALIDDAADQFAACEHELNEFYHKQMP